MSSTTTTMKAISYDGPNSVSVKEVPVPKLEHPDDAIIKVTTAGMVASHPRDDDLLTASASHLRLGLAHVSGEDRCRSGHHLRYTCAQSPIRTSKKAQTSNDMCGSGHENMGIVDQVGSGVTLLKKGDRVVMPFNVADGRCLNCEEGNTAFCTGVNPGFAGGAYGYVAMGPYAGGQVSQHGDSQLPSTTSYEAFPLTPTSLNPQAQYVRVPFADFNALTLPPGTKHEASFALLADIFPTGWHGLTLSHFTPGESVAVFGAGPVGLMAAYSAHLRGASRIYVVDKVPERLAAAKKIPGATPIDFSAGDAVEMIIKENGGKMVDRSVDAVGYQAVGSGQDEGEVPNVVLEQCIKVTRPTGGIGVPGLYVPSDPGAPDEKAARGMMLMSFGKLFEKVRDLLSFFELRLVEWYVDLQQGLTIGTGQCNVKKYNRYLRDMIISGQADPSFVVSHEIGIEEAPQAYKKFDQRIEGYTKVLYVFPISSSSWTSVGAGFCLGDRSL